MLVTFVRSATLIAAIGIATATATVASRAQNNPGGLPPEDTVVAVVNGSEVRLSELVQLQQTLPEQYRQVPLAMLYPQLLDQVVSRKLMAQAARKQNLQDDADVKARIAVLEERVLQQSYLTKRIDQEITEEKLRAAYDEQVANTSAGVEVHARHILLESEEDAKAVIEEINGGGDFAEVAKAKSTGPSASQGGDLGYFTKDQMVPEFAEAAFSMAKGDVSAEPVQTQFGWHVIKVEDRREQAPPSFADSVPELRQSMLQDVIGQVVDDLRGAAEVEEFDLEGNPLDRDAANQ
ncbi:MAG: peptidylprolyl isomerase [Kiloniellales bacterium]|nr:peptidylprolyl isomerase [Kiloniellales bacterium]